MNKGAGKIAKEDMLRQGVKRVLVLQGVVSLLLLLGILGIYGLLFSMPCSMNWVFAEKLFSGSDVEIVAGLFAKLKASIYGSALAISGTILSAGSIRSRPIRKTAVNAASREGSDDASALALLPIYSGLLNKLVIVGGGIGFGLIALDLEPVLVVLGYFVVQVAVAVPLPFFKN